MGSTPPRATFWYLHLNFDGLIFADCPVEFDLKGVTQMSDTDVNEAEMKQTQNINGSETVFTNRINGEEKPYKETTVFKNFISSLKGEKQLSYNHWRYRLLHWAFDVEDPKRSHLPRMLYTHYCPLFHVTNIIALAFPIIVAARLVTVALVTMFKVAHAIRQSIPKRKLVEESSSEELTEASRARRRSIEIKQLVKALKGIEDLDTWDFAYFWRHDGGDFLVLTEEEARTKAEEIKAKIEAAREIQRIKREKLRDRIVFWSNFSRVFIKGALNVAYVAAFIGVGYLTLFKAVPFAFWLLTLAATFNPVPMLLFMAKVLAVFAAIAGTIFGLIAIGAKIKDPLAEGVSASVDVVWKPISFMGGVTASVVNYSFDVFGNIKSFISVFYEENCPPINIVDEEDEEVLEEVAV